MTREELNKKKQKAVSSQVKRNQRKKVFFVLFKIFIFILLCIGTFYFLNKYIFTSKIVVKEKRIINDKIPISFDGLKIIHFSDLHYGTTIFMDDVKVLIELINERNPDLVVFTGDLVDESYELKSSEQEKLIEELSKITSSIGKYAIAGEEDDENFMTILNQSDFSILNNDYDLIYNDSNEPILIAGVSSMLAEQSDINNAFRYFSDKTYNSNIFTITLVHEPDLVDSINNAYHSDLFLAGHSHNNSIRYPWGGSPYKIDGALKYNEEYYKINDSELFISSGIGTNGYGIRFLCLPSINFFRLSKD